MNKSPDSREQMDASESIGEKSGWKSKKLSRIITSIVLILYGLYHLGVQYYSSLDPRLLVPSRHGFIALMHYESGHYADASRHWRIHYGMTYDPASVDGLRKTLQEKIVNQPERMEHYYLLADLHFSTGKYADAAAAYQTE